MVCQTAKFPPEPLALHGKWSPLAVGALSLVCDPMLITTVIALTRGVGRLGAAARYEREVGYHPSLPSIRTDAVWGIVLGSLRLWVLFALLAAFLLAALLMQPDAPGALVSYPDEHTEIRSRLVSGDRDERAMAARHALAAFDSGAPSAPRASDRPIFEDALTRAIEGGDAQAASDLASVLIAIGAGVDEVSAFYHGAEPEHRASLLSSAASTPAVDDGVLSGLLRVEAELLRAGEERIEAEAIANLGTRAPAQRLDLALLRANADLPPFAELLERVCAREDFDCVVTR